MQCDVLRTPDFCQLDRILSRNNSETGVKHDPLISSIRAQWGRNHMIRNLALRYCIFFFFTANNERLESSSRHQKERKGVYKEEKTELGRIKTRR